MKNTHLTAGIALVGAFYLWGMNPTAITTANTSETTQASTVSDVKKAKKEDEEAIKKRQYERWNAFHQEFKTKKADLKHAKNEAVKKIKEENKKEWEEHKAKFKAMKATARAASKNDTTQPTQPVDGGFKRASKIEDDSFQPYLQEASFAPTVVIP